MPALSNARPIAILTGYMITAAALTAWCIAIIRKRGPGPSPRRRRAVAVFFVFAAVSLATTWYHMFCYFRWSYLQWAAAHTLEDPSQLYLGEWLRDTSLFKQAWGSTLETPPRAWWSMQVFGFCANWSVMLAAQGQKRNIPHLWAFMLLGQVVAISFASNLSFLAFTVYDAVTPPHHDAKAPQPKPSSAPPSSSAFWWPAVLAINVASSIYIPGQFDSPLFLKYLLVPHILAFAPVLLNGLLRAGAPTESLNQPSLSVQIGVMVTLLGAATWALLSQGGDFSLALRTFHEHPAVSSVGWDVVCCWVSFTTWHILGQD